MSDHFDLTTLFCCSCCQGSLRTTGEGLQCTRCGVQFAINEDILCFVPEKRRTDHVLTLHHQELNRRAMEVGWRDAVIEHMRMYYDVQSVEHANECICSEACADFRFIMPVDSSSTVLDVSSGWGSATMAFARTARRVISLDTNMDNLRFVQLRAQQEGLRNVIVAQDDVCALSVRPNSCDVVLMAGALERVALGQADSSPQRLQKQALQRVHQVLKPGGCLYLAMDNRFSFRGFLGAKEPHTGLRFVSVLPRALARKYSRLIRKRDYLEMTYSLWEMRKLLHSVGFGQIDFFFPIPSRENFRFLVDFRTREMTRFVLERLRTHPSFSRWQYLVGLAVSYLPTCLERFLWPSFGVVAVRP